MSNTVCWVRVVGLVVACVVVCGLWGPRRVLAAAAADFYVAPEGDRLFIGCPYTFQIDPSSSNVNVLGMTDVAAAAEPVLSEVADVEETVTVPSIYIGDDFNLFLFIKSVFVGSDHFRDLEVEQEGRYMMLTGYGYDFEILADTSKNIDLLGFTPVLHSLAYYPEAWLSATLGFALPF